MLNWLQFVLLNLGSENRTTWRLEVRFNSAKLLQRTISVTANESTTSTVVDCSRLAAAGANNGCALGALIAALVVHAEDEQTACLGAIAWFSIAGEIASENSSGPGTFKPAFLDALFHLSDKQIRERVVLK